MITGPVDRRNCSPHTKINKMPTRMIDLLDDVNFTKVPSHAGSVLEGAPVRVLGALSHT